MAKSRSIKANNVNTFSQNPGNFDHLNLSINLRGKPTAEQQKQLEISVEDCKKIAIGIKQATKLTTVTILGRSLTDEGAKLIIEAVKENTSVTNLDLRKNNLTAKTGEAIAELLESNNTIKNIQLGENDIGEGAAIIAKSLANNSSLEKIYLNNNNIDSNGAIDLAHNLENNTTLKTLSLNENKIDEYGIEELKKLENINLISTKQSPAPAEYNNIKGYSVKPLVSGEEKKPSEEGDTTKSILEIIGSKVQDSNYNSPLSEKLAGKAPDGEGDLDF